MICAAIGFLLSSLILPPQASSLEVQQQRDSLRDVSSWPIWVEGPNNIDFGTFWAGPTIEHTFRIHNLSNEDVSIRISRSCFCLESPIPVVPANGVLDYVAVVHTANLRGPFRMTFAIYLDQERRVSGEVAHVKRNRTSQFCRVKSRRDSDSFRFRNSAFRWDRPVHSMMNTASDELVSLSGDLLRYVLSTYKQMLISNRH